MMDSYFRTIRSINKIMCFNILCMLCSKKQFSTSCPSCRLRCLQAVSDKNDINTKFCFCSLFLQDSPVFLPAIPDMWRQLHSLLDVLASLPCSGHFVTSLAFFFSVHTDLCQDKSSSLVFVFLLNKRNFQLRV